MHLSLQRKLPYYDTFPLVLPLESYSDGFLGINLTLFTNTTENKIIRQMNDFSNNTKFDEGTTLDVSYDKVKKYTVSQTHHT